MLETDPLGALPVNRWDLIPTVEIELSNLGVTGVSNPAGSVFIFTSFPPESYELDPKQDQIDRATTQVHGPSEERFIRNALSSLNQLFACEPCQVIEAFADYISQSVRCLDGAWSGTRGQLVSSGTVSHIPRYRQICIETAAKDHVVHLETITLAKEQEAPTANAAGQMLSWGGGLWKRWKSKLLDSFSRYSRNGSLVGFQTALATAAQVSSCLEIPPPSNPLKKAKRRPKKKAARLKSPRLSQDARFCPECGQERR